MREEKERKHLNFYTHTHTTNQSAGGEARTLASMKIVWYIFYHGRLPGDANHYLKPWSYKKRKLFKIHLWMWNSLTGLQLYWLLITCEVQYWAPTPPLGSVLAHSNHMNTKAWILFGIPETACTSQSKYPHILRVNRFQNVDIVSKPEALS